MSRAKIKCALLAIILCFSFANSVWAATGKGLICRDSWSLESFIEDTKYHTEAIYFSSATAYVNVYFSKEGDGYITFSSKPKVYSTDADWIYLTTRDTPNFFQEDDVIQVVERRTATLLTLPLTDDNKRFLTLREKKLQNKNYENPMKCEAFASYSEFDDAMREILDQINSLYRQELDLKENKI